MHREVLSLPALSTVEVSKGQIFENLSTAKNSALKTYNCRRHIFENLPLASATQNSKLNTQNCRRLIGDGLVCDHINGNGLDNRKANLRPATFAQNLCNRPKRRTKTLSKYKGLEWDNTARKWKARIQFNGRKIYLGSFDNQTSAARAYDNAAKLYHGDFASLNFDSK